MMDLVRLMLCTQTAYIAKRIHDKKHVKIFHDTMLSMIKVSSEFSDVESFRQEFELIKLSLSDNKPGFVKSIFNDNHKYVNLALDMTQDIINSVNSRFITGDSKVFLGLFDIKGEIC